MTGVGVFGTNITRLITRVEVLRDSLSACLEQQLDLAMALGESLTEYRVRRQIRVDMEDFYKGFPDYSVSPCFGPSAPLKEYVSIAEGLSMASTVGPAFISIAATIEAEIGIIVV